MSNLQHRQSIIQEKRKKTPWRDFVMEICSRGPFNIYKRNSKICRFPESNRVQPIFTDEYGEIRDDIVDKFCIDKISNGFFPSLGALFSLCPLPYQHLGKSENCNYTDGGGFSKNVYLSFLFGGELENACYSRNSKFSKNVLNSCAVRDNCENIFQSTGVMQSYNVFYSKNIHSSRDIWFCSDLIGCEECINSRGLLNQKYIINNQQFEKQEYFAKKSEILNEKKYAFENMYSNILFDVDANIGCEGVEESRVVYNIKNGRNVLYSGGSNPKENFFDVFAGGMESDFYGVYQGVFFSKHIYCSAHINGSSDIFYSYSLNSCSFCLGCIGLKNKSYCILNKQYTKEERYSKVDEIFGQMYKDGVLGDFFPATMNPFYFNDTAAYLIDPSFTKEEVTAKGYLRRDEPIKVDIPAGVQTVNVKDLDKYEGRTVGTHGNVSEQKRTIDDEILKKVILDDAGNAYRIIPMELEFLRKYELPLPRKHWLDRMKENFRIN